MRHGASRAYPAASAASDGATLARHKVPCVWTKFPVDVWKHRRPHLGESRYTVAAECCVSCRPFLCHARTTCRLSCEKRIQGSSIAARCCPIGPIAARTATIPYVFGTHSIFATNRLDTHKSEAPKQSSPRSASTPRLTLEHWKAGRSLSVQDEP